MTLRGWLKMIIGFIGCLLLGAVLVFVLVRFWIGPVVVRSRISSVVSSFWAGDVRAGDIDFFLSGWVFVSDIKLLDAEGDVCIRAEKVGISLSGWPGLKARPEEIEVQNVIVDMSNPADWQKMFSQAPGGSAKKQTGLKKVKIERISWTLTDTGGEKESFGDFTFSAVGGTGSYEILFKRSFEEDSQSVLSCSGVVDTNSWDVVLSVRAECAIKPKGGGFLLALVSRGCDNWQAAGQVTGQAVVKGCLRQVNSLEAEGNAALDGWSFTRDGELIAEAVGCDLHLAGRRWEIEDIRGRLCGGELEGGLYGQHSEERGFEFGGKVSVKAVELAGLKDMLGSERKFSKGTVGGEYEFRLGAEGLAGVGFLTVDDADIDAWPIVKKIFGSVGLSRFDPLSNCDFMMIFANEGQKVTMNRARFVSGLGAIRVEPGGVFDIGTGQVDFYAVAAPFDKIREALSQIPGSGPFIRLKDKLTRLRVQGHWAEPAGKLITKQPLTDIKEGTVGFFWDVVDGGGQISRKAADRFRELFKTAKKDDNSLE